MQTRELYNYVDFNWEEPQTCAHKYLIPSIERICSDYGRIKSPWVLDVGCGGGYLVNALYQKGFTNIYGFDISPSGIQIAKGNYGEIQERFFIHDVYQKELPQQLPGNKYDIILSLEVIEHLYNPYAYLHNIHCWLKDTGIVIITTPYHGYLKNLATVLLNKFDRHADSLKVGGHIKFFSNKTLCTLLKQADLQQIEFYGAGRIPLFWKSMITVAKKM